MRITEFDRPIPREVMGPSGKVERVTGAVLKLEGDRLRKESRSASVKEAILARGGNAEGRSPYKEWVVVKASSDSMRDARLTTTQRFVLSAYVDVMKIGNLVDVSQRDMAAQFSCSLMTVSTATKKLIEYGYLVRGPDKKLYVSRDVAYRGSWNKFRSG